MNNLSPALYTQISNYNGSFFPSSVHTWNNATTEYYTRLLTQRAMSVFKFKLPDTICRDYFLYNLYLAGYVSVFYDRKYGIIAQWCGFEGVDLYYNPVYAIINNQFVNYTKRKIDTDCIIFKLQPDYFGCFDTIQKYSELLSQASQGISASYINSMVSKIFTTIEGNKDAEEIKKAYDKVYSGSPLVTAKLSAEPKWFNEKPKDTFIVNEILQSMRKIMEDFDRDIGIPVATEKKERLTDDEVHKNDVETMSRSSLWLEHLKECCEKANKMFSTDSFDVEWRFNDERLLDTMGSLQLRQDNF